MTKDPELRTTTTGLSVCSFTVAVNRRKTQQSQQPEADFFRVNAWREMGENCAKYLAKGRKVAVVGAVRVSTYTGQNGKTYANMDVDAQEVEFLSPRDYQAAQPELPRDPQTGFEQVEADDLPF